jgi:NitT/TauT family transport system substrate-binding protein
MNGRVRVTCHRWLKEMMMAADRLVHVAALVGLAAVLAPAARAQDLTPFRVGIAAQTVNMLPMWMAEAAGLFAARGLKVEIVNTDGGSRGLAAVSAGQLQAMNVGLSAVIDANKKGGDLRLIASSANTFSFGFFGAAGVKGAADLKGRTVGVSSLGSESDTAVSLALKQLGLDRRDVTVVEAGATLKRLEALRAGQIQATALNEPANILAERHGLPKLVDLAEDVPWIFNGVVVGRAYLAAHRDTVMRFLEAYIEGIHLALSDEERTKTVLSGVFKTLDAPVIKATYDDFKRRIPRDAAPSQRGAENMLMQLPALGTEVPSRNVSDYVDASLIEELRSNGFFAGLKQKYRVE